MVNVYNKPNVMFSSVECGAGWGAVGFFDAPPQILLKFRYPVFNPSTYCIPILHYLLNSGSPMRHFMKFTDRAYMDTMAISCTIDNDCLTMKGKIPSKNP